MTQIDIPDFPIIRHGHKVGEYLVSIRPADDMGLGGIIYSSDVSFEDANGDRHPMSHADAIETLKQIKRDMPHVWREIEEAVEEETISECIHDRDCSVYADAITFGR